MAKIHENAVDSFSEHLNSIDQHIQFTSEQEKDGRIPFLDTCVSINQDGSPKISADRKPTNTDQYLNFQSNHHLQHKRAVVSTLMLRAQTLVTENDDRTRETQHVKQALKMNNYPEWMLTIPHPKSTTEDTEEPQNEKKIYASTPYIKGISERLQNAFKSHEVTLIHKPVNSLRSQFFWYVSRTQLSISRNAVLCTRSIVRSVIRSTLAKRPLSGNQSERTPIKKFISYSRALSPGGPLGGPK